MDIENEPGKYIITFDVDAAVNQKYDTISDFIIYDLLQNKKQNIYKIDCYMLDEKSREDFILNSLNPLFRKYLKNKTPRESSDGISHIGTSSIVLCEKIFIEFYIIVEKTIDSSNADLILFINDTDDIIINNLKDNQIVYIIN